MKACNEKIKVLDLFKCVKVFDNQIPYNKTITNFELILYIPSYTLMKYVRFFPSKKRIIPQKSAMKIRLFS